MRPPAPPCGWSVPIYIYTYIHIYTSIRGRIYISIRASPYRVVGLSPDPPERPLKRRQGHLVVAHVRIERPGKVGSVQHRVGRVLGVGCGRAPGLGRRPAYLYI